MLTLDFLLSCQHNIQRSALLLFSFMLKYGKMSSNIRNSPLIFRQVSPLALKANLRILLGSKS